METRSELKDKKLQEQSQSNDRKSSAEDDCHGTAGELIYAQSLFTD